MPKLDRADVIAMLTELAALTTLKEESPQSFKVRAYENACQALEAESRNPAELSASELQKIKGIGKATAAKIRELVDTGSVTKLEDLRASYPPEVVRLSKIPGLGPKKLKVIRSELGVENLADLERAIVAEQIRSLPGMGVASELKLAKSIERLGLSGKDHRTPIADALPLAERLVADLEDLEAVVDVAFCGSLRRFSETIGDIDITVASLDPEGVMEAVRTHREVTEVILSGKTKTSFLTASGLQVDVRVVAPGQFGAAMMYFTGSKAHNIALRQRAINQGAQLNEYGLFQLDDDGQQQELLAAETEQEVYGALAMAYVPPPMREATGEIERAVEADFEKLIQIEHIRGDLHYHTDRSGDGRSTVPEMVAVAAAKGYEYLAITDHGEDLAINGSSQEQMLEHREVIRSLQENYPDMAILYGCELNIGKDGGLDYDPDFRAMFDYTVASVHSHFDQSAKQQTKRLVTAISDPSVHSIGHLTGRYIGKRPGIELEIEIVLEALIHFDVALEVNGALQRLDAASSVVRLAVDRGVKLVINTDSHHTSDLGRMAYGVLSAQRGWAERDQVVNTWERDRFLDWVNLSEDFFLKSS